LEQFIKNDDFEGFRQWCASEKSQAYDEWRVAKFRIEHPELSAKAETGVKMWLPLLAKENDDIREKVLARLKDVSHIDSTIVAHIIQSTRGFKIWNENFGEKGVREMAKELSKFGAYCPSGVCSTSPEDFLKNTGIHYPTERCLCRTCPDRNSCYEVDQK